MTTPTPNRVSASDVDKPAKPPRSTGKGPETLKVAYTVHTDGAVEFVVFGTDSDRTEFLRDNQDTWWRITDITKGHHLRIGGTQ